MRNEYPRPDLKRPLWQSLNGQWHFKECGRSDKMEDIEVPYVPQSAKSGIGRKKISNRIIYEKHFNVEHSWSGKQILIHFGAVDYKCEIYINGNRVGEHTGGHTPFTFDITEFLSWDEEVIKVVVTDDPKDRFIPRGKQFWHPDGEMIWYTPCIGIWQSVWLEPVSFVHIEWLKYDTDIDTGLVSVRYFLSDTPAVPYKLDVSIRFKGESVFRSITEVRHRRGQIVADVNSYTDTRADLPMSGRCWTPESPSLYDVHIELGLESETFDQVDSYFGMRKIEIRGNRVFLNNLPYYQKLVLDQGYWKDCLWTAPSEENYQNDILLAKSMGFNGCRKHEKTEDPVFLYWADRLGFLIWESMPSCWNFTPESMKEFSELWMCVINRDYNHPCIILWDLMNENWGIPGLYGDTVQQNFATGLYRLVKSMDPSRLIIINDGWYITEDEICAFHTYSHGESSDFRQQERFSRSLKTLEGIQSLTERSLFAEGFAYRGQPIMVTEVGGISLNHGSEGWAYSDTADQETFLREYGRILDSVYESEIICGFCYTQLADVEQEKNGLLNEEHHPKVNPDLIKAVNDTRKNI